MVRLNLSDVGIDLCSRPEEQHAAYWADLRASCLCSASHFKMNFDLSPTCSEPSTSCKAGTAGLDHVHYFLWEGLRQHATCVLFDAIGASIRHQSLLRLGVFL